MGIINGRELKRVKKHFPKAKKAVLGEGPKHARLMFIGEAPGRQEDTTGRPFVGRAGRFLDKVLAEVGISRKECFITSVVKFLPAARTPDKKEIELCLPLTLQQIKEIKPQVICLLGNIALNSLLDAKANVGQVHGKVLLQGGIKWIATFHPAAAMRNRRLAKMFREDLKRVKNILNLSSPARKSAHR